MHAFHRLALACTLLWAITSTGFALAVQNVNEQQAAPPGNAAPAAAPAKGAVSTGSDSLPPRDAKEKDAPKLKPEGESAVLALRNQLLADKVQIDQIQQQAQQQIQRYMQDMQQTSRLLAEAQDKAFADAGIDKSKWKLADTPGAIKVIPVPPAPPAKPAEPPKKP